MGKKINWEEKVTYDEIYDKYINKNMLIDDLAKLYGCSRNSISRLLKTFNIQKPKELLIQSSAIGVEKKYGEGITNVFQSEKIKNVIKEKCIERYGVDNPSKSEQIKQKKEKTNIAHYGVKNVFQSDEIKNKLRETNIKKYGNPSAAQSESVRNKIKNTMVEKYGYPFPKQSNDIINEHFSNANSAKEYILENFKNMPVKTIAEKINISYPQLLRYIRRYNLQDYVDFKPSSSIYEAEIIKYLNSIGITNISTRDKTLLGNGQEIDIYLPDYKIGIEINGNYWHSDIFKDKKYHYNKSLLAENMGIHLIHIYEYELIDTTQLDKIKSILKIFTNKIDNRIYARKCVVRKITNAEAKEFNNHNHLQGHRNAKITYGLFYNDELVQLMSFSKHNKYGWEIIRGCPGSNNIVIGGVSKLFNAFVMDYNPDTVFSYCDFNKFDGHGYLSIGMKLIGYTGPDKNYLFDNHRKCRNSKHYTEYQDNCDAILWGAGSKKYLWTKEKEDE